MRQNRWIVGLAMLLFLAGSAWSLYRMLYRTDQELETMVFDVNIVLNQYPMPFSDPGGVRCPPALADGEKGTVHLSTTNEDTFEHTLTVDYGECHLNLDPGEAVDAACNVRANDVPDDFMAVHMLPVDVSYTIYNPREPLCSIPIVNVGGLSGQMGLIALFLPGLLLISLGEALWLFSKQHANRRLRTVTITGVLLDVVVLVNVLNIAFLTNVTPRAYLLIALTAAAALLLVALIMQLIAWGVYRWRQPEG